MKNMKRSLLALALISMTTNLLPHGGGGGFGGGFATGAIIGTGLTLAATSGSRNYQDPDTAKIKGINKDIELNNKAITKLHIDLQKGRISQDEHDKRVAEHQENINSLQKQRVQVRA